MKMPFVSPLPLLVGVLVLVVSIFVIFRPVAIGPTEGKPIVSATIFPLYDILRTVAGEDVETVLMLPAGAEPHSFDPTPSIVRDVQRSEVVYAIGHGLDSWTGDLTDGSNTPVVIVDKNIPLRSSSEEEHHDEGHEEEGEEEHHEEDGHNHGPIDPHYWLDVENAIHITETVRDDLSERFPEHREAFAFRAEAYIASLTQLDARLASSLNDLENKHLITFHDAWYYFAEAYGLEIVGTFEPAPGREPSPRDLGTLLSLVKEADLKTLYTEPLFSSAAIDAFVQDNHLTTYAIDDIGGTTPETDSYIKLMEWNGNTLKKNR